MLLPSDDEWLSLYKGFGGELENTPILPLCVPGSAVIPCAAPAPRVLTVEQANEEFTKLAAADIPYDYPVDCCYSRAHAMCAMLAQDGYACEKYFYYKKNYPAPSLAPGLAPTRNGVPVTFPDQFGNKQPVIWGYHVAPLVPVKQADGQIIKMVLDPSIADKPVTQAQWRAIQGDPAGATDNTTPASVVHVGPNNIAPSYDPDYSKSTSMMEQHKARRDANKRALQENEEWENLWKP